MIRFEDLLEKVRAYSPDADVELLRRAYVFSAFEHRGQVRHSGEPYLIHPLAVADFLADMKLDVVAVAAGLLHDVVEDTLTTIDRIRELFGPEVAHVVEGVTKISAIRFASSEERQAENFRKMLLAMVDDIRVILVKLADRLHNMRTLSHLPEDKRVTIAQETRDIYAPIANRLGMSKVKNELEELSFRYLEPQTYEALRAKVDLRRRATEGLIEQLRATIVAKLNDAAVPFIEIDGRIKRLWSISQKLKKQRIELDQVYDFIALRIITSSVKDCYGALGIIHQTWSPVPGRIKDFIAMPRPNGYQSLHTSVISEHGMPFEVQIRTLEMHRMAEEGVAAHWKYKEGRVGDHKDERYFQWMRQLLEYQQEVRDPQEFIQNLKVELYPEEVYTFTPKGQVKALPRGATPIDFAYSIHTDVGHQCVGARVNGKMVPLRARLKNGDIVEIITAERPQTESRLAEFRRHVACPLQDQASDQARGAGAGASIWTQSVRKGITPLRHSAEGAARKRCCLQRRSRDAGVKTADDLFALIGYGTLSAKQLLGKLVPAERLREKPPDGDRRRCGETARSAPAKKKSRSVGPTTCWCSGRSAAIRSAARRSSATSPAAKVCRSTPPPVRTSSICCTTRSARSKSSGTRAGAEAAAPYTVKLTMEVEDRKGVLAAVSAKIADINTNIKNMEARTGDENQPRADRRDRRDQRRPASREGDQVAAEA